ncbi:GntR family transcriptional regulator [Streptomyces corynorhini]|uniref:GntR family transcriptional regulator n=1 Tax=Streptomyces corynorhini TaxID=2282652 RepID=A0A370AUD0_9ACTN|nr:GntR family transcriptional regulator [Streptomyces corynorhini]RDG33227.1 GntR family transcriptional regulator [Streptomyces corynorhini]
MADAAYRTVAEDLRRRIGAGEFAPGDPLPSRAALARAYGVGSNVAAAAVRALTADGLVKGRAGRGVFVRERPSSGTMARSWTHERLQGRLAVRAAGPGGTATDRVSRDGPEPGATAPGATKPGAPDPGTTAPGATAPGAGDGDSPGDDGRSVRGTPRSTTGEAPPDIALRLAVPAAEPVIRSEYMITRDGRPAMFCVSWEPLTVTGGTPVSLPGAGPMAGSSVVARMSYIGFRITRSTETVTARTATREEADALDLTPGAPVAAIERTYYAGDRPLETADLVVPGERFRLAYEIPAEPADG